MKKITVKTKNKKYSIIIGSKLIQNLNEIFYRNSINSKNYLFVVDARVPSKFINIIKNKFNGKSIFYKFSASEKNKNLRNIEKILNILQKSNFNRNDCVVAVGGGILGDVSSFAASIFKRGLLFVNIPTTLLSQVDSSIGGKTGVNTKFGKNLIGSFYQPNLVITDTDFLESLPPREILCGYGEILKHAIIKNKKFFEFLSYNVNKVIKLQNPFIQKSIYQSCLIKKQIVEKDENEKGLRKLLNFGHTFGHAYEATLGYSKKLNHGEAVILGIYSATEFSLKEKILNYEDYIKIIHHIKKLKYLVNLNKLFKQKDISKILYFMKSDKKNINKNINLILIKQIGKLSIQNFYKVAKIKKFLNDQISSI
tara:strand:- start:640 stop:1740 length:1101 start_codon:yes stop_codon:yes gene_type:complete